MLTAQPEFNLQPQALTQYDWQVADTILPILSIIKSFTSWSQARGPQAGALLWKICMLKSQLAAAPAPDLGGFKTELVQSLTQNLQTYESDEGYQIAHVLDPRYKGVCIPEGQLEVIKETLTTLLAGDQAPAPPVPIAPPAPQPPLQGEAAMFAQLLVRDSINKLQNQGS